MNTAVFILAGGSGTRLWPLSTNEKPKQFLSVFNNDISFFQHTVSRALKIADRSHIFILTQTNYFDYVTIQAPQIPAENIFCESHKRNTAPAIAVAMQKVKRRLGDMVSVIFPADHYIADEDDFLKCIRRGTAEAERKNGIITIGIPPTRPDTSFGYIKCGQKNEDGLYITLGFKEKPDKNTAFEFISAKNYFWNSGIIITKISFMINQFEIFLPDVSEKAKKISDASDKPVIDNYYSEMPNISIDYGVLEKTNDVFLIKGNFGWDDIGSWSALERLFENKSL